MLTDSATLAIVDDHPIVLEGLQRLLSNVKGITISGCFTTGTAFMSFLKENKVDVLLLDITLPDVNGIDLCKEVKSLSPDTHVLALSNHAERSMILQMIQHGATGYLLKNISSEELIACIREALSGMITFSKGAREIMARPSVTELKGIPQLTRREKEILHLISDGKTTPDIAAQLNLSPLTVETHRKNLIQKFQVKNMAALIKIAAQQGLI
ncbi:response regulator transcription factor [Chitinophaga arvensicola]|uniref:DNA-binding response regulator, NarL/FixJ family, contains REC and HTH domains n=1 Tax=Chitinophaga arvensicola TaxID=29529 RepID=A0A1I0S6X1_9BACT|nr:response regulator transcription factor [Chitinophaga arvensicola]SEW51342.1 DNA-binding response regulator, NarL/FixJ family, contains REC and HTH domains [Chitinophaga arvensicola]